MTQPIVTLDIDLTKVVQAVPNEPMSVFVMPTGRTTIYVVQEDSTGTYITPVVFGRDISSIQIKGTA